MNFMIKSLARHSAGWSAHSCIVNDHLEQWNRLGPIPIYAIYAASEDTVSLGRGLPRLKSAARADGSSVRINVHGEPGEGWPSPVLHVTHKWIHSRLSTRIYEENWWGVRLLRPHEIMMMMMISFLLPLILFIMFFFSIIFPSLFLFFVLCYPLFVSFF